MRSRVLKDLEIADDIRCGSQDAVYTPIYTYILHSQLS